MCREGVGLLQQADARFREMFKSHVSEAMVPVLELTM